METEEKEDRGSGRSQNVVHTLPRSMASVPQFLTGPLERIDPDAGSTQVLVITPDAETALALAEAVLRLTGPAGIELLPVTSARRAARIITDRPIAAAAGSPRDLRDLVKSSHLKLDGVKTVVLAWAEEILAGDAEDVEALEAVMNELPKDAARVVVTSRSETRVNAFAERYLRRAPREETVEPEDTTPPVDVRFLTVSGGSRIKSLRRLLDDMDPPSAAIIVSSDESEKAVTGLLRTLGYHEGSTAVRVSRGPIEPATYAAIFHDAPIARTELAPAVEAGCVVLVALVEPRERETLKRVAGGDVRPFTLSSPGLTARDKEAAVRRELATVLDSGIASREVLALEALLERYDGIEIAAAALRLLEKERLHKKTPEPPRPPRDAFPARPASGMSREGPRGFSRGGGDDRGGRPDRDASRSGRFRDSGGKPGGPPRRGAPDHGKGRPPGRDR